MASIEPTPEQIQAFMSAPIEGPILMVNLLRFAGAAGRAEYMRYAAGVAPHLARVGARVVFHGMGQLTFIGDDGWDEFVVVEYPSRDAFLAMVGAPEYQAVARHRHAGLADSRLYCTQRGAFALTAT